MNYRSNKFVLYLIATGLIVFLSTGFAARTYWNKPSDHLPNRVSAISDQLRQASDSEKPFATLVGNSLVERLFLTDVCDLPVVNAGVGRARIQDLEEVARIARASAADLRILSIGVNDIARGATPEQFATDYAALFGYYEPDIVVGVTGENREPYNTIIRKIARGAAYVEPLDDAFLQSDKVHYTAEGALEMKRRLEAVCDVALPK